MISIIINKYNNCYCYLRCKTHSSADARLSEAVAQEAASSQDAFLNQKLLHVRKVGVAL